MKAIFTFLFFFLTLNTFAQKAQYLDRNFMPVSYKEQAAFYSQTTMVNAVAGIVRTYHLDGKLVSEEGFSNLKAKKREGITKSYYDSGILKTEVSFKDGIFDGPVKTYYPNQRLKRAEFYEKGKLVAGKCFTTAGFDTAYYAFQTEPEFPGGYAGIYKYLENNSRFATTDIDMIQIRQGFNNYVIVKFVVTPEGTISDVLIRRPLGTLYDREVIRLITQMPKWTPGSQDGQPISREMVLPVGFRL